MKRQILSNGARSYQPTGRKSEIESLRKELDILNRSMEEADRSIEEEGSVRIYAREMREVANLIESVLDEYDLMTAKQKSYLRKVGALIGKLRGRDNLSRNIGNIKALLVDIRAKGESLPAAARASVVNRRRRFSSSLDEELGAVDRDAKALTNAVLVGGESRRSTVVVTGEGGVGKTFLVERVYESDAVAEYFEARAWITIPDGCIAAEEILSLMASQVLRHRWEEGVSTEELGDSVRESLRGKRYLIVFDKVRIEELWRVTRDFLPDNGLGSRVIVTTRSEAVVSSFIEGPSDHIHRVEPLMENESWELFCRIAFPFDLKGHCPEELWDASAKIVRECGGFPLVIRVVAGLLSTKSKVLGEWLRLLENLSLEDDPDLGLVYKAISLGFDDLPPHLKKCFMYFSVFEREMLIQNEKLIRLWITEGFVQEMRGKTLEEVAEEYLEELVGRNLVEACKGFYGIEKFFRAHDLIHDLVRMKGTNRDFCMVNDEMILRGNCRRMKIPSANTLRTSLNAVKESGVRSVFLWNTGPLDDSVLVMLFKKYYLLTILDMEDSSLEILPKEVGNMSFLKYLSLKNTRVRKIPNTIGALSRLEVFDLSGSRLVELPMEIAKLGSLRHLLASHGDVDGAGRGSAKGVRIKEGIGAVANLQTLTVVDAKLSGMNVIQEMIKLKQLRKLRVSRLTSDLADALSACISEMAHLKSLHLESMKNEILDLQNVASPPTQLEYLVLRGKLLSIPNWIPLLGNLRIMCLSLSSLVDDPLPILCLLPNLESLWLYGAYRGPRLVFQDNFRKMKLLVLREMWGLESVEISDGAMPFLEELRIGSSPLLKEVPAGIARLSCLRVVSFYDMPDEFVLRLQHDEGSEFQRIQHVPSILICYRNTDGRGYISYKLGEPDLLRRLNDADTAGGQLQDSRLSFSFSDEEGDTSDDSFQLENIGESSFRSDMLSVFSDDIED